MQEFEIRNSKGEVVVLNAVEKQVANAFQKVYGPIMNAMGVDIPITTLTTIIKSIAEQKFFEVSISDYVPVVVGEGSFGTELLKYASFITGGDFEEGLIFQGTSDGKLALMDAGVEAIKMPIFNWAKKNIWNIFELQTAIKAGNWDIITAKEKSRAKNWQLGIQRMAFIGSSKLPGMKGLLNQDDVTFNTSLITKPLSTMTAAELNAVLAGLPTEYRANASYTANPKLFIIPESDFNGLLSQMSETYPLKTKLQVLTEALQARFGSDFKVLPLAYADKNVSGLSNNVYTLSSYDPDSVAFYIPVDYTPTLANTLNGFTMENAAYGQFSSVKAFRPKEMLYLGY